MFLLVKKTLLLNINIGCKMLASQLVLVVKNPPTNAGDARDGGSTPGLGSSPGEGSCSPLQYSCLGSPMDKEEPGGLLPMESQRVGHN